MAVFMGKTGLIKNMDAIVSIQVKLVGKIVKSKGAKRHCQSNS